MDRIKSIGLMTALLLVPGGLMFSCKRFIHKIKTGDHANGKQSEISAAHLERLKAGATTTEEFRAIFGGQTYLQMTYRGKSLDKVHQGKKYRIDRIIAIMHAPHREYEKNKAYTAQGWSERIFLAGFFTGDVLQFYTVSHETRTEDLSITLGPLNTVKEEGVYWPDNPCDVAYFHYHMLGDKRRADDVQDCAERESAAAK